MKRNSEIDSPTRVASDQTIRLVLPLSCIMKYNADTMLAMISAKAMGTRMCMEAAETEKRVGKMVIISPRAGVCPAFVATLRAGLERDR